MGVSRFATRSRSVSYWRALLGCTPAAVVLGAVFLTSATDTVNGDAVGWAIGMVAIPALLAALVLWLIARRRAWRFWKLLVVGSLLVLAVQLVLVSGFPSS